MPRLIMPVLLLALGGCVVGTVRETSTGYDHLAPPTTSGSYYTAPSAGIIPAPGSYCEEAVVQAQDAARQAYYSGSPQDRARADRAERYARRDCR